MIINILGTMGIGKTTIINALQQYYNANVIAEQFDNNPYWKEAYSGKKPQFFKMQVQFMNQYMNTLLRLEDLMSPLTILDQCFYTTPFVLTQNKLGLIDDTDTACYMERWELIKTIFIDNLQHVQSFVLHDTSMNIYNQLQQRGREEEKGITFEFIDTMNQFFKSKEYLKSFVREPVVIDVTYLYEGEIPATIKEYISKYHDTKYDEKTTGKIRETYLSYCKIMRHLQNCLDTLKHLTGYRTESNQSDSLCCHCSHYINKDCLLVNNIFSNTCNEFKKWDANK